MNSLLCSF